MRFDPHYPEEVIIWESDGEVDFLLGPIFRQNHVC